MAGILDWFNDPSNQGILALSSGLLSAGGPSRMPVPVGAALGQSMLSAGQAVAGAQHSNLQRQMMGEQLTQLQNANKLSAFRQQAIDQAQRETMSGGTPAASVAPGDTAGLSPSSSQSIFGTPAYAQQPALSQGAGAAAGSYFNPQALYRQGKLYADAGLPGGVEMMNAALSHDPALRAPVNVRQGGTVVDPNTGKVLFQAPQNGVQINYGPGGPVAAEIPGYQELTAKLSELEARGKSKYDVVPVTTGTGATVPMFKGSIGGFPTAPGAPSMLPSVPGMGTRPLGPLPAAAPAAPAAPAPSMGGRAPSPKAAAEAGDVWASVPRMHVPTGMGQTTYDKNMAERAATVASDLSTKLGSAAQVANERKTFNDQAMQHLNEATTGPGALGITEVQNFLTSRLGISPETIAKAYGGDASATTVLNKDLLNAATQTAKANFGQRMTQSEVMMQIKQGAPNADMTKAAIKYLLDTDNARAGYQIKQSTDLGNYLQKGGDPHRFEGWYAEAFPMSGMLKGLPKLGAGDPATRPPLTSFQR